MSDEMVQEKVETTETAVAENTLVGGTSGEGAEAAPISSDVAAEAVANEPAPAQPVAESAPAESVETPAASQEEAETPAPRTEDLADDLDMNDHYANTMRPLQEADVIYGTVVRVDREGVWVDVGAKSEGLIRPTELSRDPSLAMEDVVQVGERIRVYVLEPENQDGNPILSKKRADFEQAWERVQVAKVTGELINAFVTERVKGGLTVDLGIRGFVPASHVGSGSLKINLDKYVGQTIALKVIEVDKDKRKVVLSNKMAAQEEREAKVTELKATLAPGQIRSGTVRRLTNYGAFIDLGGIDGLLHISEMSWTRINDPKEVMREGQSLDVLVLKVDLDNNRVSLGRRQILPDPWTEITQRYKEGDIIKGSVTRTVPFGAFVQVEGGVEGIIPNAEMPRGRGGKAPAPQVGDTVEVKVISLRPDERKMTLSMRAVAPPEPAEPSDPAAPPPPREGGGGGGGGGGKRRKDRSNENEDYGRFMGREEPRFGTGIGDALKEAQRRARREQRRQQEEEEYFDEAELDVTPQVGDTAEVEAAAPEVTEAGGEQSEE